MWNVPSALLTCGAWRPLHSENDTDWKPDMSLTKAELEAINRRLHDAVKILSDENLTLHEENQRLLQDLASCEKQLERLTRRYGRLSAYVKSLHAWLNAHGK